MSFSGSAEVLEGEADIGFHEVPDGSNCNPYSDWQYHVRCPGGGYCCSACSKWAHDAGFRFGAGATYRDKGFSYTGAAIEWAKHEGLWRPSSWRSKPGDWWIFDWNRDGNTDHVEMVKFDDGVMALLVGGNTGNSVAYRRRDRKYHVGTVALSQSKQAKPPLPTPAALAGIRQLLAWQKAVTALPLELGDRNDEVVILHRLLVHVGLLARMPKDPKRYTMVTAHAVWHLKDAHELANTDGKRAGADVARVLLAP